tara:strand:- start:331 stop:609 length:279 start_codon:yes stop_codon:yes gene_type:complete
MTNNKVCKAWVEGKKAKSNTMRTDGISLFSYKMKIGQTLTNGKKEVLNVRKPYFYSMTTSNHVGIALQYCYNIVKPVPIYSYLYGGSWYVFP